MILSVLLIVSNAVFLKRFDMSTVKKLIIRYNNYSIITNVQVAVAIRRYIKIDKWKHGNMEMLNIEDGG